jgi:hypothetical protein
MCPAVPQAPHVLAFLGSAEISEGGSIPASEVCAEIGAGGMFSSALLSRTLSCGVNRGQSLFDATFSSQLTDIQS